MNTNHTIFFTQLYYPDMTTTATIMTDLVEDLAAYGLDTTVVCAQPTYIKNSDPQITQINADLKKMKDQRTTYKIIDQQITPVRSPVPTPVPSAGATGRAGQAQITQIKIGGSADWRKSPRVECHNGVSIRRVWSFLFDKNKILGMAASQNLDNIIFIPFQPLDRLAESLSMADVALIGIYPENEGVIMPSKLYGLLAVGKPIICVSGPKSEVVEILNKAEAGVHSSIDDPKELAQKIVAILDDPEKAEKMGQNGRQYFLEYFERKKVTRKWEKLLKQIYIHRLPQYDFPNPRGRRKLRR